MDRGRRRGVRRRLGGVPRAARSRLLRRGERGRGAGAPGDGAAGLRRPRDPAAPDSRRLRAVAGAPAGGGGASAAALPERAGVAWRGPMDARALRARGRLWTLSTAAHSVPFVATAGLLVALEPGLAPVSALALAHAWGIPELYANRGAKVVLPKRRRGEAPERTALGLLGDLVGHEARELRAR